MQSVLRIFQAIASRTRNLFFRLQGLKTDGYIWMQKISIPRNHKAVSIGTNVALDQDVVLLAVSKPDGKPQIEIGESTYINRRTIIDASHSVMIGKRVGIGPMCYITDHDHGTELGKPILEQDLIASPTIIEDDVWLGFGVIVLKGVTIGQGSVIAAGSVVARSIPENVIAEGRPARVVRKRK